MSGILFCRGRRAGKLWGDGDPGEPRPVPRARLIDVREPYEYEAGHIPGIEHLPMVRLDELEVSRGETTCSSASRARAAAWPRWRSSARRGRLQPRRRHALLGLGWRLAGPAGATRLAGGRSTLAAPAWSRSVRRHGLPAQRSQARARARREGRAAARHGTGRCRPPLVGSYFGLASLSLSSSLSLLSLSLSLYLSLLIYLSPLYLCLSAQLLGSGSGAKPQAIGEQYRSRVIVCPARARSGPGPIANDRCA